MSRTNSPCSNCNYSVYSDDDHDCIVADRAVEHPNQFPSKAHWVILTFDKNPATGYHNKPEYRAYFSEPSWKQKIAELTEQEALFTAFKASKAAKITTQVSIDIDIEEPQ